MGYSDRHKGYKCFYPPTRCMYISRHVLDEEFFPFRQPVNLHCIDTQPHPISIFSDLLFPLSFPHYNMVTLTPYDTHINTNHPLILIQSTSHNPHSIPTNNSQPLKPLFTHGHDRHIYTSFPSTKKVPTYSLSSPLPCSLGHLTQQHLILNPLNTCPPLNLCHPLNQWVPHSMVVLPSSMNLCPTSHHPLNQCSPILSHRSRLPMCLPFPITTCSPVQRSVYKSLI